MGYERIGRPISYVAWSKPRADSRSDLIHRPGVGTSLGKVGVKASPETVQSLLCCGEVGKSALMERRPCWLGRVGPSQPRSRLAARSCAGLDGAGAHRAIITFAIIGLPQTAAV